MSAKSSKEILKLLNEYKEVRKDFKKESKFNKLNIDIELLNNNNFQIVDKTTKISINVLMFWSFFKKNKPYG